MCVRERVQDQEGKREGGIGSLADSVFHMIENVSFSLHINTHNQTFELNTMSSVMFYCFSLVGTKNTSFTLIHWLNTNPS